MTRVLLSTGHEATWCPHAGRWSVTAPDGRLLPDRPRTLLGVAQAAERDLAEIETVAGRAA